jgi:hypothetical protein
MRAGERDRIAEAIAKADPQAAEDELATLIALTARPTTPRADPAEILPGVALEAHLRGQTLTPKLTGKGVTPALAAGIRAMLGRLKPVAGWRPPQRARWHSTMARRMSFRVSPMSLSRCSSTVSSFL